MAKSAGQICGDIVFGICGPKGSLCCFVLSAWAVIMLFLLGGFYYVEAVVLLEDFVESLNHTHGEIQGVEYLNQDDVTSAYHKAAFSCWGAGVIYLFFLVLSGSFMVINIMRSRVANKNNVNGATPSTTNSK